MINLFSRNVHLGIIKGGQLGRMMIPTCLHFGIVPHVLDQDPQAPVRDFCHHFVLGDAHDFEQVVAFGRDLDALTVEIEHINLDGLRQLQTDGVHVAPGPDLLAIVQDKGLQKQFYDKQGFPTAPFHCVDTPQDVIALNLSYPLVLKSRTAGYDGRGVWVVESKEDLAQLPKVPCVVETKLDVIREISVMVARRPNGEIALYPTVEMIFNPVANMLDYLSMPANISIELDEQAHALAEAIADQLQLVGVMAVEMFIDAEGELVINEIAPRPHNSGHHTIEANYTSQFEQHIRAIFDLPLGKTDYKSSAVMVNIVGEPDSEGDVCYEGLSNIGKIPDVYVHLYGKAKTRPYRKMGHITILREDLNDSLDIVDQIRREVRVTSCPNQK
jgi:5-(carboxyamino)imidazole ribonucleotide synthase